MWVVIAWAVVLAGIGVRLLKLKAGQRSVFPVFQHAGRSWLDHADLYPEDQKPPGYPLFRYSPPVAAAFVPLALLPTKAGDLVWRAVNAAALLGGFALFLRTLSDRRLTRRQTAAAFALLLPAAVSGLGNGQCNALVIGLILVGYAAAGERQFTLSAVALAAATLLKLYPVAPALLLVALHPRRLGWRYGLALVAGFALSFILADPAYVVHQFDLWARYFLNEDRSGWPIENANLDLQFVVTWWIGPMTTPQFRVVEVAGGLLFAALTTASARRLGSVDHAALLALGLGCVWMTTLGPATESPTYLLLAPPTALAVVRAWTRRPADWVGRTLTGIAWALPVSFQFAQFYRPLFDSYRTMGPQPVAGLVLAAALIWDTWAGRSPSPAPVPPRRVPAGVGACAHPMPGESP
jgi:hypothetical protein